MRTQPPGRAASDPYPRGRRPRVAIYARDSNGLGELRRSLRIAGALTAPPLEARVLVISGAPTTNGLAVPPGVDSLTLPVLEPRSTVNQEPPGRDPDAAWRSAPRSRIIAAALDELRPELFLVHEFPGGSGDELAAAFRSMRARPGTRCVLGLGDIAPDPDAARRVWADPRYADSIRESFNQILVYGDRAVYDRLREDRFPADLEARTIYTGYLVPNAGPDESALPAAAEAPSKAFVLCTLGGGYGGFQLGRAFCRAKLPPGPLGVLLAGPFLPPTQRDELRRRVAARTDLRMLDCVTEPALLIQRARRIISVGGYATMTELLGLGKRTLIVTGGAHPLERRIRAERLEALGLVDLVDPHQLDPQTLADWMQRPSPWPRRAWDQLDLGGLARLPRLIRNAGSEPTEVLPD